MSSFASGTIAEAVANLTAAFAAAGIDSSRLDARVLVGHALGIAPSLLFARATDMFPDAAADALAVFKLRRLGREPVSRIIGRREFFGLEFVLGEATLDPRADSETLVNAALALRADSRKGAPARILDLGTGTGCLLLAILSEWPEATGLGIDLSPSALEIATGNAARLSLAGRATFQAGDWCADLAGPFDLIVSNPPYIAESEIAGLEPEVARFDPMLALIGGADGLEAYRRLVPQLTPVLTRAGTVLLEVGAGQADSVAALCRAHGLRRTAYHHDLGAIARVVQASPEAAV